MTPAWEQVEVEYSYPRPEIPPQRPENLEEMISLARSLSAPFDFVRVDLYDVGGHVKFGALTHYPTGGNIRFQPRNFDEVLGGFWKVPT